MGGMRQLNFKSCVQDKKNVFTIRPWTRDLGRAFVFRFLARQVQAKLFG